MLREGGFATDADGFAAGFNRAIVFAMCGIKQPCAVAFAKVFHQPHTLTLCQFANGVNVVLRQFGFRLWGQCH